MTLRQNSGIIAASALVAMAGVSGSASPQSQAAALPAASTVSASALQAVMPRMDGWAKVDMKMKQVTLHKDCTFTFVSATYVKDDMRVVITLADAGEHADSLMSLVPMIAILPDGYHEKIPPALTIKRLKIQGSPGVESWDSDELYGETAVIVNGRMVAKVEGWLFQDLDALRSLLQSIDLKKLGELK